MDANLSEALFIICELSGAIFANANLSGADLGYTNLSGADLSGADLSGADLSEAEGYTQDMIARARILKLTILPDGTKLSKNDWEREFSEWCEKQGNEE